VRQKDRCSDTARHSTRATLETGKCKKNYFCSNAFVSKIQQQHLYYVFSEKGDKERKKERERERERKRGTQTEKIKEDTKRS